MNDIEDTQAFLRQQEYMVIAVSLPDSRPWATPVKVQKWDGNSFEWDSVATTEHSKAIEQNPEIAIVLYTPEGETTKQFGFYARAKAMRVGEPGEHGRARYRATIYESWINDASFIKRKVELS